MQVDVVDGQPPIAGGHLSAEDIERQNQEMSQQLAQQKEDLDQQFNKVFGLIEEMKGNFVNRFDQVNVNIVDLTTKTDQAGMSQKEKQDLKAFMENTKEQLEKHDSC